MRSEIKQQIKHKSDIRSKSMSKWDSNSQSGKITTGGVLKLFDSCYLRPEENNRVI